MTKNRKIYYFEIALYLFILLIALVIPLFIRFENGREWSFIFREWRRLIPFFLIFLINNFFLAPRLLFKSKFLLYITSCVILLILMAFSYNLFFSPKFPNHRPGPDKEIVLKKEPPVRNGIENNLLPQQEDFERPQRMNRPLPSRTFLNFSILIIGILIIGFNSGIKFFVRWMNEQDECNEKERQYLSTELAFLKQQVSPHFFMNTLNNIHALVDVDAEEVKNAIIKLSRLMRYLLYENDADKVSLEKEIDFLESYVELMRLRYDESMLSIIINYPENIRDIKVPALLFLPLIENAFKHGVRNNDKSFIDISFDLVDHILTLNIRNSKFEALKNGMNEDSGIGMENITKRLELIYGTNYKMIINTNNEIYDVLLSIPV